MRKRSVVAICFAALQALIAFVAAADPVLEGNDILVATSSRVSNGSDLLAYSSSGKLKFSINTSFPLELSTASLGLSGSLGLSYSFGYAFLGSPSAAGKLAVFRVNDEPEYLETVDAGKNIKLGRSSDIAMGDAGYNGESSIFVSEGVGSSKCKVSKGQSIASRIVELQYNQNLNIPKRYGGNKSTFKRLRVFDAYRSSKCSELRNVVVALRKINNTLYAVLEEKPGVFTLRSFDAFKTKKPKASSPIVSASVSFGLYDVTIDSPTSFVAQSVRRPPGTGGEQYQLRAEKSKAIVNGTTPPGKRNESSGPLYGGGLASYTNGSGVIAASGNLTGSRGPFGNTIYKFDAKSLQNPRKLFTLKRTAMCQALLVAPQSAKGK